jgi:hypothetical protein
VPRDRDGLYEAVPGGSPANVAVGLARLEVPTRMVARLADDPFGRRIRRHLAGNGVDLGGVVDAAEPTSLAIVAVDPDGGVSYDFRVDGTADWQWRDEELGGVLDGRLLALHAGSLALTMAPGADALLRLLERARGAVTISYDPNCRPLLMGEPARARERVERLVALADVVKASVEDVAWLLPGRAAEEVAEAWLALGRRSSPSPEAPMAWWPWPPAPGTCAAPAGAWPWSTPSAPATPSPARCWRGCTAAACWAPGGARRSGRSGSPRWARCSTRGCWRRRSPAPAAAPTRRSSAS